MRTVAHFQKNEFDTFDIIDDRNGETVKRGIKKMSDAGAYVQYYNEEIAKAEATWLLLQSRGI